MNLDPRTLLFSLILVNSMMVLSLFVAATSGNGNRKPDGIGKWAIAILLETLTWILVAARGVIPDLLSVIVANGFKAGAHAMILVAIYEFQRRPLPHWQWLAPVVLTLLMGIVLLDDISGRFIWGGLIYAAQMALIAYALMSAPETRAARASRLLLGGVVMIMLVLALRALAAFSGLADLGQPQPTGSPHPVQIIAFIAIIATTLLGSMGFLLMVKERADKEILHLAMTDSLTGVPNRRSLMDHIERELARRSGKPLALLMIDVDHFKSINDTHGHPVGDEVLRQITEMLVTRLRGGDVLGRYGGEEFCVLAPDTGAEGALMLAESLRETIASTPVSTDSGKLSITVSIGISECPANVSRELKQLLAEADAALYSAKQAGRNRVVSS